MTAPAAMAAEEQHRWTVVVVAAVTMNWLSKIGQQRGECTIRLADMCRKGSEGALDNEGKVKGEVESKLKSKQRSSSKRRLSGLAKVVEVAW